MSTFPRAVLLRAADLSTNGEDCGSEAAAAVAVFTKMSSSAVQILSLENLLGFAYMMIHSFTHHH